MKADAVNLDPERSDPPASGAWRRRASWALLILLAGVLGSRGVELARHGWQPTAPGEARWLAWAGGNEWERAALAALPEEVAAGVGVQLVVRSEGPVRPDWLRVRAQYRWPAARVVAATVVNPATGGEVRDGPAGRDAAASGGIRTIETTVSPGMVASAAPTPAPTSRGGAGRWWLALALAAGVSAAAWWLGRRGETPGTLPSAPGFGARPAAAFGLLTAALALFLVRLAAAPLWSWDHHAIWGMKARRLAALGLEADLLAGPAFTYGAGHYPVGWPLVLAAAGSFTGDGLPGPTLFRLVHGALGCLLAVLVVRLVVRLGGRPWVGALTAAWVAASPLVWDTESFGLADLPLAVAAVLACWLLVPSVAGSSAAGPAGASALRLALGGAVLGLLPWLKQEGWVLASGLGLLVALPAAWRGSPGGGRVRRLLAIFLPAALLAVASRLLVAHLGGQGTGFLAGDWRARFVERLGRLPEILGALAEVLSHPAWLGLWWLAALAVPWLLVRSGRRRTLDPAAGLALAVIFQLAVYGAIYLATYLDPRAHVDSSFLRIAAALAPLAAVLVATGGERAWAGDGERTPTGGATGSGMED